MPIDRLLRGHRRFKQKFANEYEGFIRLATEGQKPKVLWIGCSDSRVIPEQIMTAEAGQLFIMRNVANIVPPFGKGEYGVGAVIEYAVLHLQVSNIVICGHTQCGGIKALEDHIDEEQELHIARWLEIARPAYLKVEKMKKNMEEKYLETIKANVLLQSDNLRTYKCVQEAEDRGRVIIYSWLYDLHTGDLFAYNDEKEKWESVLPEKA